MSRLNGSSVKMHGSCARLTLHPCRKYPLCILLFASQSYSHSWQKQCFTCVQDGIASDTWGMMVDLINLDRKLSDGHPENRIPASMLGAITPHGCQHDPKRLVKELEDGWRPVLLHPDVPSIVHVPWLTHLDALVQTCGICMTCRSEGHAVLTKVCSTPSPPPPRLTCISHIHFGWDVQQSAWLDDCCRRRMWHAPINSVLHA